MWVCVCLSMSVPVGVCLGLDVVVRWWRRLNLLLRWVFMGRVVSERGGGAVIERVRWAGEAWCCSVYDHTYFSLISYAVVRKGVFFLFCLGSVLQLDTRLVVLFSNIKFRGSVANFANS